MRSIISLLIVFILIGCGDGTPSSENKKIQHLVTALDSITKKNDSVSFKIEYNLKDFFLNNKSIDDKVENIFNSLNDNERIAQMIITSSGALGKNDNVVKKLVRQNKVGGVIFLGGNKESYKKIIDTLNKISSQEKKTPLIYSIDAEPSLFNSRILGSKKISKTIDIKTNEQCDSIVKIINNELLEIGIHQNLAPVCDVSPQNEAIKHRSFGNKKEKVIELSKQFIFSTQEDNIVATAKHFPGHGLVKGDTHKKSVYIDGKLKELSIYEPIIKSGVISIMISHITIRNNSEYKTDGLPSSCSKKIVTDLLKEKLNFKGIIISDALNIMKAVNIIDNAPLLASKAGCDMILMPIDEIKTIDLILNEMKSDENYKCQVYESVKKIIKLKICLGLIQ